MPVAYTRAAFAFAVLATSVMIHLGLLGVIVMAERRGLHRPQTETMEVELVKPEMLPPEQTPPQEEPKKKEIQKPAFPELKQNQQQQRQQQQAAAQSAAPSKPEAKPQSAADAKAQQQTAKAADEVPPPDEPGGAEQKPDTPSGGPPSETKAKLTAGEIAAFRAEVQKCWELMVGVPDAMKLEVVLRVGLSRKGTLLGAPELLKAPASAHGPRLAGIAIKAISACGPYRSLPVAKYNEWKVLDLRFLATGLAGLDTSKVDVSKLPRG